MEKVLNVTNLVRQFHVRSSDRSAGILRRLQGRQEVITAVNNISFSAHAGDAIGYIGVNGAGKSTTIKLLAGILVPTSGQVTVLGITPHRQRICNARNIGVMFGQRTQLWWDLPLIRSFELLRAMYHIPCDVYDQNLHVFAEVLDIGPLLDRPVRSLSLGQRVRADLVACLLHNPRVVYLDEPTIGLDMFARDKIRDFLRYITSDRKTTLFIASHNIEDIEQVCSRVIVIHEGQLVYEGGIEELRQQTGDFYRVRVDFFERVDIPDVTAGEIVEASDYSLTLRVPTELIRNTDELGSLLNFGPVKDLSVDRPDLEYMVKQLLERNVSSGGGVS